MWYAKTYGSYDKTSVEAESNVMEMADTLRPLGWSDEAIAAMLGNGAGESGLNPWRWETNPVVTVPTYAQYQSWTSSQASGHGYGLWQFTPASNYIESSYAQSLSGYGPNFLDRTGNVDDGHAQTEFMAWQIPNDWSDRNYNYYAPSFAAIGVDINDFYWMSYADFIAGNVYTLDQMTGAYELKYERPSNQYAASGYSYRCQEAQYWYNFLTGHPYGGHIGVPEMWYFLRKKKKRKNLR